MSALYCSAYAHLVVSQFLYRVPIATGITETDTSIQITGELWATWRDFNSGRNKLQAGLVKLGSRKKGKGADEEESD